ncbi:MAG TPA: hypothetical protein PKM25_04410 [Candidatus Ozemobacteraceae bacterium]|nr:hypothetical protein [Candidatus Ozemobacteraceae bacterium]
MNKSATALIVFTSLVAACVFAQEAPRERILVTRPGNSASFQRHRGQGIPGGSFTFRYRFEGNDGAIHRICKHIAAETGDEDDESAEDAGELPDTSVALRLQKELTQAAIDALNSDTASAPVQAGVASEAPRQP